MSGGVGGGALAEWGGLNERLGLSYSSVLLRCWHVGVYALRATPNAAFGTK